MLESSVYMKSEKKQFLRLGHLADLLLLFINSIGIAGALVQVLQIPWAVPAGEIAAEGAGGGAATGENVLTVIGLDRTLFWGGLFLICMSVLLLQKGGDKKRVLWRMGICAALYLLTAVIFREKLLTGWSLGMQNTVKHLNERYLFHITWPADAAVLAKLRHSADTGAGLVTGSVLFFLFPLELAAGFFWNRGRGVCLLLGNMLWLLLAFTCNVFPDYFFLIFCVLGMVGALVQKEFADTPGTGVWAAACVAALAGLCMGLVYRFLLPEMDRQYDALQEDREAFYRAVNEEWIPALQNALPGSGYGFGGGPDVTGELYRRNLFSYTGAGVYSVTVDSMPPGALYLKGFTGGTYGEEEWEAWPDAHLEDYYGEHGLDLPSDYAAWPNITYMAVGEIQKNAADGHMAIREIGGRGSYSIYPYGALLTEEFQVRGDGSAARRGKEYGFQYRFPEGYVGWEVLSEDWAELEAEYRQYVYDNFLEYPRERLPLLTRQLEQDRFQGDSIHSSILEVMSFLSGQASYNLDVGRNPSDTDFVEYFLFDSHEGYCVHFASAAVLALRYLGIPARYVTGYVVSPSDFSANDENTYTAVITGKQAHAWAEIYLDGVGWIPVEMTPGAVAFAQDNRLEQAAYVGQLTGERFWMEEKDFLPDGWEEEPFSGQEASGEPENPVPEGPEASSEESKAETADPLQEEKGESADIEGQEAVSQGVAGSGNGQKGVPAAVWRAVSLILAAVGGTLAAVWTRRRKRARWHRRLEAAGAREEIFLLYRELRRVFRAAGCPGRLAADGRGFQQFLRQTCPRVTGEEYEAFCGILEKNTFGDREPSGEELQEMRFLYEKMREEVYGKMPFYKRVLLG
ncbi:Protein-glutamine gamma-glutamyltransferase [Acetatifactor muris]|uniref:Protein-glutamine gamma-glutamyltransferase n=2 Tax=Acetatifactor muris TaxID=879566 RepID=A0A2K4ZMU6_9FIRM|nr:Protein-glutamine gamma-glutamyltransferase [Acetatifactor muris]